jgi:hypothetical protein
MPLSFPIERQDRHRSKVQFQVYRMVPTSTESWFRFNANPAYQGALENIEEARRKADAGEGFTAAVEGIANKIGVALAAGQSWSSTVSNTEITPMQIKEVTEGPGNGICNLYMPVSYTVNEGITYDTGALNMSGATALNALNSGQGGFLDAIGQGILRGITSTFDFFTGSTQGDAARLAAARLANNIPLIPQGIRNAIPLALGVTVNPNTRAIFKGVSLREFTFQFKFISNSKAEADEVKRIVQFFRINAYPEDIPPDADLSVGFKFPNMFKIKLMHKASDVGRFVPVGSQIKLAYLRTIQTNYNPTNAVFHSDGNPLETDISVTFQEYKTISRRDVELDHRDEFADPDLLPPLDDAEDLEEVDFPPVVTRRTSTEPINLTEADKRSPF